MAGGQSTAFEFPARIFVYEREEDGFNDYESQAPGYGYSAAYAIPEIYSRMMTAYVYDRLKTDIPVEIEQTSVANEFERSLFEAFHNSGFYGDVEVIEQDSYRAPSGHRFHYAAASLIELERMDPSVSLIALTTWNGKYFKLRLTQPPGGDAVDDFKRVLDHWADYLWMLGSDVTTPGS